MKCKWLVPTLALALALALVMTIAVLPALLQRTASAQESSRSPREVRIDALTSLSHRLALAVADAEAKKTAVSMRDLDSASDELNAWIFKTSASEETQLSRYDLSRTISLVTDMGGSFNGLLRNAEAKLIIAGADWAADDYASDLDAFISKHPPRAREIEGIAQAINRPDDRSQFLGLFYGYLQYDHCRISLDSDECRTATAVTNGSKLGDGVDVRR